MSSWCAADNGRDFATVGGRPLYSTRAAVASCQMVSSNSAINSVFDLSVAHLHRLIALHIVTKFLA
jgi:hypothetical protein